MKLNLPEQLYQTFSRDVWERTAQVQMPVRASFEITYRCNIHCLHCYTDPFNTPMHLRRELKFGEILRILDQLAEAGVLWITLTGGEAFVHPQFRQIYQAAKQRGFILGLFSNGTVITDDLADFLSANPPFQIEVSLHAATAKTFEHLTQVPGSFKRFDEGVRRLLRRGLPVKIKTKAMTLNRGELSTIKAYVESLAARGGST